MAAVEWVSLVAPALLLSGLVWERRRVNKRLAAVRECVHVSGSRGKSTVTRLVTAGLRGAGRRTLGKVTGMDPMLWLPTGEWVPVRRRGRVSIGEQRRLLKEAERLGVTSLVVECMAIQPEYQWWLQTAFLRPSVTIVTNAVPDHIDTLGSDTYEVAESFARALMVPHGAAQYVTIAGEHVGVMRQVATERRISLHVVVPDPETAARLGMDWPGAAEHVALALKACELLGVDREKAVSGLTAYISPSEGEPLTFALEVQPSAEPAWFVNAFSANEPVSTVQVIRSACSEQSEANTLTLLLNCRRDRPERTYQWLRALERGELPLKVGRVYLTGQGTHVVARRLRRTLTVHNLAGLKPDQVLRRLLGEAEPGEVIAGVGNWHGVGRELIARLAERERGSHPVDTSPGSAGVSPTTAP